VKIGEGDIVRHAYAIQTMGALINLTSVYLEAPDGSGAEEVGEEALTEAVAAAIHRGPEFAGHMILNLTSLIIEAGDQERVQQWFNQQAEAIEAALG
jgi:hypothetical protein